MTDYDDLVKRLQRIQAGMANEEEDAVLEAVAAITALVKELHEAREDAKASGKAYDEVLETKDAMRAKLKAAEAEVAALDSTCRYQAGEINRLVAALDFYADPKNWMSPTKGSFALQVDREPSPVEKTGNSIAMVALKQSCLCKIEMATFRSKGSTCPHCGKVILTSSNL